MTQTTNKGITMTQAIKTATDAIITAGHTVVATDDGLVIDGNLVSSRTVESTIRWCGDGAAATLIGLASDAAEKAQRRRISGHIAAANRASDRSYGDTSAQS